MDLWARRQDGSEFPTQISLSPISHGTATMVIRDISDRVVADAQARLVQASIDAVFLLDPVNLQFTHVNQGAISQTGYSRAALLVMTLLHIKPEFTRAPFEHMVEPLLAGRVHHHTFRTVHRQAPARTFRRRSCSSTPRPRRPEAPSG